MRGRQFRVDVLWWVGRALLAGGFVAVGSATLNQVGWLPLSEGDGFWQALPEGLLAGATITFAILWAVATHRTDT